MKKQELVRVLNESQTELLQGPNYSRIVHILRQGELSAKEIHTLYNKDYEEKKTLTSIYRYMETLVENGLVYVSKEEVKRGHLIEKYYSRTAKIFLFENERKDENAAIAASELAQKIFNLDEKKKEDIKKLFREWTRNLHKSNVDFFSQYGDAIVELEKTQGFKPVSHAAEILNEFLYLKENSDLMKKILETMER